ncbi:bifunctional riboflavin kinase/FAD synthetase [bacterium]|nr:bifunctional riboflavin kinase/FAD synthetase [bacterium]
MTPRKDCIQAFLDTRCDSASCVTVGNFDGVHKGHCKLIETLLKTADKYQLKPVALTFSPHPEEFFSKQKFKLLMPLQIRVKLLQEAGVEEVKVIEFSKDFSKLSYQQFLDHLIEHYHMKKIIVGENTHVGKERAGSPEKIKAYLQKKQIDTKIIQIHQMNDELISSSKIRELIMKGEITIANKLLGYSYFMCGEVIQGSGKGKSLGFPTANLNYSNNLCLPKKGVYKTSIILNEKTFPALTNVGQAPTIKNSKKISIESFIPQYGGKNLYGQKIQVIFHQRLRSEKKFSSVALLQEQIKKDLTHL